MVNQSVIWQGDSTSRFIKTTNGKDPTPPTDGAHVIMAGTNNNKDPAWLAARSDATLAPFEAIIVRFYWGEVEGAGSGTTSGTFDFSTQQTMLNACAARGMPVIFMGMWRNFNTSLPAPYPSDLAAYRATVSGGYTTCMSDSTVMTRYINMMKALIDEFKDDDYFYGVQSNETAGVTDSDDTTTVVYSVANYETQLNRMIGELVGYSPNVQFQMGYNFIPGSGNRASHAQSWSNIWGSNDNNNSPTYLLERVNSTAYSVGDRVFAEQFEFYCTTAGTSGSSPPTWITTLGSGTTDGTVTWECRRPTYTIWLPDVLARDWPEWTGLGSATNGRVYHILDAAYDGFGEQSATGVTHFAQDLFVVGSMQFDSYLGGDPVQGTAYSATQTIPTNGAQDWSPLNLFLVARDYLNVKGIYWTFDNARRYTFDSANTGKSFGDAVAVAQGDWNQTYDAGYAD